MASFPQKDSSENNTQGFREFGQKIEGATYTERVGAYGIAIREDKILIEKAKYGYFLPGGGVEGNETIEEALIREICEETGYEITSRHKVGQAIEYVQILGDNEYMKKINHFYVIDMGNKSEPTYPDGHSYPVEWMPIEIKEKLLLESQRWAIEEVIKHLSGC